MECQPNHRMQGEHTYEEMTLPDSVRTDDIKLVQEFRFKGDILIASYPKTGTTWLIEMTWLILNNGDTDTAKQQPTYVRVPYLENSTPDQSPRSLSSVSPIFCAKSNPGPHCVPNITSFPKEGPTNNAFPKLERSNTPYPNHGLDFISVPIPGPNITSGHKADLGETSGAKTDPNVTSGHKAALDETSDPKPGPNVSSGHKADLDETSDPKPASNVLSGHKADLDETSDPKPASNDNVGPNPNGSSSGLAAALRIPRPAIFKTHLRAEFFSDQLRKGNMKVLVPLRNPKDALVSMFHFYRSNKELGNFPGSWNEFFELFREQRIFYGDIFRWYESWWLIKDNPHVMFVTFEDMKKDLPREIKRISSFAGVQLSADAIAKIATYGDFENMKNNDMANYTRKTSIFNQNISRFMRKGQIGDWQNYFTEEQNQLIDRRCVPLKERGLTFTFQ